MALRSPDAATAAQRRKRWGKLLAFVVLVAVVYLQPRIQAWLNGRSANESGTITQGDSDRSAWEKNTGDRPRVVILDVDTPPVAEVDRAAPGDIETTRETPITSSTGASAAGPQSESERPLGELREIRNNVFESTAGLQYVPGSADNHRLKHVLQHAKDDTSKEVHGVFQGNRDQILAAIDEAYQKALKGGRDVRHESQNNRLVYTVNLGKTIGYVGGSDGRRRDNPECHYLRIVLEDSNIVISAYPTQSF